ncbi:Protoheme IX farnesyltransferase, mitochondrial [Saitoella coloradoensis]
MRGLVFTSNGLLSSSPTASKSLRLQSTAASPKGEPISTPSIPSNPHLTNLTPAPPLSYRPFLELSKPRLTMLVVLTTMSAYAIAPFPASTLPALLSLTIGTTLCSASANAFNMLIEPPFDAQMTRTRNRPLVRGAVLPNQALAFATAAGVTGVGLLTLGTNMTVAGLGLANIVLYAGVYTPMKRISIANTWVGALVGALPPLMGWAALDPTFAHPGGWALAGLLFAWQFPHFNALAWNLRSEYARAGYRMTSVTDPALNARVALRYSLLCLPLSWALSLTSVCDPVFLIDSTLVNGWLIAESYKFWKWRDDKRARKLFLASIWHLPLLLGLAMVHKVGLWDWLWELIGWYGDDIEVLEDVQQAVKKPEA